MNKILFCACSLVLGAFVVHAGETRSVPTTQTGLSLQSADYGGYDYSTGAFTVDHITASITNVVFVGVVFSSGNTGSYDFVEVWDATSTAGSL